MRKILICVMLLIFGLGARLQAESAKKPKPQVKTQPAPAAAATVLPTPLPAELFQGQAREAYKIAAEMPDVLAGLACYCGCDRSQGHRHLLDCFVDDHGAT
jgi:hypothetical protein